MTDKEKIEVLNELINKYAQSPYPHERTWIFYALKEIREDIKSATQPASEDLEEAAKDSAQRHFPDEYNIWGRPNYEAKHAELAFKEGANWQRRRMLNKAYNAYCQICGHYAHSVPTHICRQNCQYYTDFRKAMKDEK